MKKNKLTIYLTVVIILFVCVLYVSLKDDYKDILNALNDVNILFLLIGVFFMGSLQLFFIGFLGEYILNINTRVMNRPLVVEERRINFDGEDTNV